MAQAGNLTIVRSLSTRDFLATLAQNAGMGVNLPVPGFLKGPVPSRVRGLVIISVENLAWEVQFYSNSQFQQPGNLDGDGFLGYWAFGTADGVRVGGAGNYFYYIDGLDIPIVDQADTGSLHLLLVNRSAGAKTAGAAGAIVVSVRIEQTLGF